MAERWRSGLVRDQHLVRSQLEQRQPVCIANHGDGVFSDVTTKARVRDGGWGWGACFADFDNDVWLDIFHTNGWFTYGTDRSKLFMNLGGRFRERAARHGIVDERSGRAVACFDYDRDGDTDILVGNHNDLPRLYRNDGGNARSFLDVVLVDDGPNTSAWGSGLRNYERRHADARAALRQQLRVAKPD